MYILKCKFKIFFLESTCSKNLNISRTDISARKHRTCEMVKHLSKYSISFLLDRTPSVNFTCDISIFHRSLSLRLYAVYPQEIL